jgi:hypothetical protein
MTTHKSDAVTAGIMPDYAQAGVVLCRSSEFTNDAVVASGDTIQMVPIPKGAKVMMIQLGFNTVEEACTGCTVGYGGDVNAFADPVLMTADNIRCYPSNLAGTPEAFGGFLHTFTADDTIDIMIPTADGSMTADELQLNMAVWYKMTGVITDES